MARVLFGLSVISVVRQNFVMTHNNKNIIYAFQNYCAKSYNQYIVLTPPPPTFIYFQWKLYTDTGAGAGDVGEPGHDPHQRRVLRQEPHPPPGGQSRRVRHHQAAQARAQEPHQPRQAEPGQKQTEDHPGLRFRQYCRAQVWQFVWLRASQPKYSQLCCLFVGFKVVLLLARG